VYWCAAGPAATAQCSTAQCSDAHGPSARSQPGERSRSCSRNAGTPAGPWRRRVRIVREPFARRSWAEFLYAIASFPLGITGFAFTVTSLAVGVSLSVTLIGLPLLAVASLGARGLGAVTRGLARSLLNLKVAPPPPFRPRPGFAGWIRSGLSDAPGWRAHAYLVLKFPVAVSGFVIAVVLRLGAIWYVLAPLRWALDVGAQKVDDHGAIRHSVENFGSLYFDTWPRTLLLTAMGVLAWWLAPWALRAVLNLDRWLVTSLLGAASLSKRVHDLERARSDAVDGSAAQLRRIERDLHDGAQAELVGLAMKLGLAKDMLDAAGRRPGGEAGLTQARTLVGAAHHSAKIALTELRDLARGVHPPVLDQGLDAALTTLAARSAIPVGLAVTISSRPSPAIETVVYFCAAELLTNVAKHGRATGASAAVTQAAGMLRMRVTDDGVGGAHLGGGGLTGLTSRLGTVDGRLEIDSPPGGPTVVTVQLPSRT
jgi:signal transduction histidine kinase